MSLAKDPLAFGIDLAIVESPGTRLAQNMQIVESVHLRFRDGERGHAGNGEDAQNFARAVGQPEIEFQFLQKTGFQQTVTADLRGGSGRPRRRRHPKLQIGQIRQRHAVGDGEGNGLADNFLPPLRQADSRRDAIPARPAKIKERGRIQWPGPHFAREQGKGALQGHLPQLGAEGIMFARDGQDKPVVVRAQKDFLAGAVGDADF